MSKLWEPNEKFDTSKPQTLNNMPYKRLYGNLTQDELTELLRDAKRLRWEVLDLRRCGLNALPEKLPKLSDLRILNIGNAGNAGNAGSKFQHVIRTDNVLKDFPDFITHLTNLQELSLTSNPIRELPDSVMRLTNLKKLYLGRTQISVLPDSIGKLSDLQELYLWGTQISVLPDSITHLTNLQELSLSDTPVRTLPDSITRLTNLQSLDLRGCHLKAIPYSVVSLGLPFVINKNYSTAEPCVNLTEVTLEEGDLQLFAQPREVIEAYYKGQTQIKECKVIFLGDGGAGKTALIERITKGTFTPGTPPTDGIETTIKDDWFMSVDQTKWEDEQFTVRFLDFGGQEIMHAAHRCFLTDHTVYVVVCDSRDDPNIDATAARWLESVKAFASKSPVILALNKADLNANASVNQRDLEKRNDKLKCVLKTSAHDAPDSRYGVNHLIDAIRDEIPGAINDYKVNADMLSVKRALEDMTDDYISSERYREICAEHHITDKTLQYGLLGFFRDLGVAYYYETKSIDTRLESVRVLNPEWLTNGIYRLILRTREDGFLNHTEIKETLRATHAGDVHREITYTPEETEYILHVMRYFEISHDMGDGVEMIPMKMPKTPPASIDEFPKKDALHLRWEGTYLPNNLIHRLLIRKFPELDTNCVWRTGGRFRQIGGGCEALAEMNDKALDVYVNGDRDCRQYLETFRSMIRDILGGLNLKTSEVICCTVDGQEGYIPYEDVVQQYYDKQERVYISGIRKYVNPAQLLRDTYYDWEKEAERYRERMFRPVPPPEKLPEKTDDSFETEKTQVEIENIRSDTEKNRSETEKNKSETRRNNLLMTFIVALAVFIGTLAWLRPDMLKELLEWLISLPGALSS